MTARVVLQQVPGPVAVEYEALLRHCLGCNWCRQNPKDSCTSATRLRRAWSAAWRVAR